MNCFFIKMSNNTSELSKIKEYGSIWYFKERSLIKEKPLHKCLEESARKGHKLILSRQNKLGRVYGSYRSPIEMLKNIGMRNVYMYEILPGNLPRYLYADIEWIEDGRSGLNVKNSADVVMEAFNSAVKIGLMFAFNKQIEESNILMTIASGKCKQSYHYKLNNVIFLNQESQLTFWTWFLSEIITNPSQEVLNKYPELEKYTESFYWSQIGNAGKITKMILDMSVYGNNQAYKMLGQSKYGSDRVQLVHKGSNDICQHMVGVYDDLNKSYLVSTEHLAMTTKKTFIGRRNGNNLKSFGELTQVLIKPRISIAIPEKQLNDVGYYLQFIPNNGECEQHWMIWCAIGMSCHQESNGTDKYLQTWIDWSKEARISKVNIELTCRKQWRSFRVRNDGYKISTLKYLARLCQPLLDMNDKSMLINQITSQGDRIIPKKYSEQYCRSFNEILDSHCNVLIIQAYMGRGKTTQIFKYLEKVLIENPDARILYLSPRQIFAENITGELNQKVLNGKYDFHCYTKIKKNHSTYDQIIMQMESLWKLDDNFKSYDVVVMDESESCLKQFSSESTMDKVLGKVTAMFEKIIKTANKIIAADAFISTRTIDFLLDLRKKEEIHFQINEYKELDKKAIQIAGKKLFFEKIIVELKKGKKIFLVCATKSKMEWFEENLLKPWLNSKEGPKNFKYKAYHSDNDDSYTNDIGNVNQCWGECQLIMTTPRITVGINFDLPNIFDYGFIYGSCYSCSPRDIFQTHLRVRHLKENTIYFYTDNFYRFKLSSNVICKRSELEAFFVQKRDQLSSFEKLIFTDLKLKKIQLINKNETKAEPPVKLQTIPYWLKQIHIHNTLEDNLTRCYYKHFFYYYLRQCGYNDIFNVKPLKQESAMKSEKYYYSEIDDIGDYEAETIKERMKFHEATFQDKLRFTKFVFKSYLKSDLSENQYEILYNYYYSDPYDRMKFMNLLIEWKTNQGLRKIREQLIKDIDGNHYAEMVNCSSQKNCSIKEIFLSLGVKNSLDTTTRILEEIFIKASELILSNEKKIRTIWGLNKEQENHQTPFKLLNLILKKWGFSQLVKRRVRKRSGKKFIDLPPIYQLELVSKDSCEIPDGEQLFELFKQKQSSELLINVNYLEEDE